MSKYAPYLGQPFTRFVAPQRYVHTVFIHCSASSNPEYDVFSVDRDHRARGWNCIGYQIYIERNGNIVHGRGMEYSPAAQGSHNSGTIAICLNGLKVEDFSDDQLNALRYVCNQIDAAYTHMRFRGHTEVANKTCPVFDYRAELGLNEDGYMTFGKEIEIAKIEIDRVKVSETFNKRDECVLIAQGLLTARSPVSPGVCDGVAGTKFTESVKAFQERHNMIPDGVCGPSTWEVLEAR